MNENPIQLPLLKYPQLLLHALPALHLRLVQQFVRLLDQLIEVGFLAAAELINTDGNFHIVRLLAQPVKTLADLLQILHHHILEIVLLRKYKGHKLISPYPGCYRTRGKDFPKLVGHPADCKISSRMAKAVVNFLKMIQIAEYQECLLALPLLAATDGTLHEPSAVQKLCQLVILRHKAQNIVLFLNRTQRFLQLLLGSTRHADSEAGILTVPLRNPLSFVTHGLFSFS